VTPPGTVAANRKNVAMRRRSPIAWIDVGLVGALCAFGAALRVPGLTSRNPWFDDAWAALPSRVGLHDALRMVVTTPLWTIGLRWWIQVLGYRTWWAQLPALIFGIAGIAAVYALVRALRFSRLAAFLAAAVIAASPITVVYSTRIKEYSCDLVLACLVLWCLERWRRAPDGRALAALCAAGVVAIWTSASTAAVVGGAAVAVCLVAWANRERRRDAAGLLIVLALAVAADWLLFLRHLPHQLRVNWRTHGFLFGYSSVRHVAFAFQQTFSGIAHGLAGLPIPYTFKGYSLRAVPMGLAILTVAVLVCIVVPPLMAAVRSRGAATGPTVAAAAAIVLATAGTLVGQSPLGDGRTDEALYPALLVLCVSAARWAAPRVVRREESRRFARAALAGTVSVVAVIFGVRHVAQYPPTGLGPALAEVRAHMRPGDLIVIDGYESFAFGVTDQAPWRVSFAQGAVPWPMGFHVMSNVPTYVLSSNYLQPDASFAELSARTHRLWFIWPSVGGYSTSAPSSLWALPFQTPTLTGLQRLGWHGRLGPNDVFTSPGTYAQLFTHP